MPKLADVAEINPRFDRSQLNDLSEVVSFVPMANVSEVLGAVTSEQARELGEVIKGFTPFKDRDVLVAKITPCFENGKIAHARIGRQLGFGSTEFHVIRPIATKLDDRYLYHFLRQPSVREEGGRRMTGSGGQKRVPKTFIEALDIPLPSLTEQRRIAAILDKADALRAKRREAMAKLDQLLQSVFLEMFGDPVTNPKGWPVVKSGDLFSEKPRIGTTMPATGVGCLVVRVGEIGGYSIALDKCSRVELDGIELEKFLLRPGDTVIARAIGSKEQLGKCSYYDNSPEFVCIDSHVMRLRPNPSKTEPAWFHFLLSSSAGKRMLQSKGGATAVQFNINASQVSDIDIPLPPLALQREFLQCSRQVRAQMVYGLNAARALSDLFLTLQQRAFAGEL